MLLTMLALGLAAQEPDCRNTQNLNQADMNMCAAEDFGRADRQLNQAYQAAVRDARAQDRDLDRGTDNRETTEQALRNAQRAWVTFRDAHCSWYSFAEARGGSLEPMLYEACRARVTRARTAELEISSAR